MEYFQEVNRWHSYRHEWRGSSDVNIHQLWDFYMAVEAGIKEIETLICCCFVEGMHRLREEWAAKGRMVTDLNAPGRPGGANR